MNSVASWYLSIAIATDNSSGGTIHEVRALGKRVGQSVFLVVVSGFLVVLP